MGDPEAALMFAQGLARFLFDQTTEMGRRDAALFPKSLEIERLVQLLPEDQQSLLHSPCLADPTTKAGTRVPPLPPEKTQCRPLQDTGLHQKSGSFSIRRQFTKALRQTLLRSGHQSRKCHPSSIRQPIRKVRVNPRARPTNSPRQPRPRNHHHLHPMFPGQSRPTPTLGFVLTKNGIHARSQEHPVLMTPNYPLTLKVQPQPDFTVDLRLPLTDPLPHLPAQAPTVQSSQSQPSVPVHRWRSDY